MTIKGGKVQVLSQGFFIVFIILTPHLLPSRNKCMGLCISQFQLRPEDGQRDGEDG